MKKHNQKNNPKESFNNKGNKNILNQTADEYFKIIKEEGKKLNISMA